MKIFHSLSDPTLTRLIQNGAVGILPTDTIYGIVARGSNPEAVQRLYALKNRVNKPGTVIAASVEQLQELGVDSKYLRQVQHLWPNSISIKLPIGPALNYLQPGSPDGAFRVIAASELKKMLEQTGPLLTTSANHQGMPPAANLAEAQGYFGDQVDFYVDGGELGQRPPSTVIRLNADGQVDLIREGAVKIDEKGRLA